jgi:hypothetical protein
MPERRAIRDKGPALEFLERAYEPEDWVAIFLKSYDSGRVAQRVGPGPWVRSASSRRWLEAMNRRTFNVYVSVNAIAPGRRARTRDAIAAVRHVFLEADQDGAAVLGRVEARRDLPDLSYVLHSSPGRIHLFWRAAGFDLGHVERLQRQLARELGTDPAATPVTQCTRLPDFWNHKREPYLVTIEYRDVMRRYRPEDFPPVVKREPEPYFANHPRDSRLSRLAATERARRYLVSVPPAVAGQHGDVHTFCVCCRVARGFALDEDGAVAALSEWNARCVPPWSTAELLDKIRRAGRYGREPVGGLL